MVGRLFGNFLQVDLLSDIVDSSLPALLATVSTEGSTPQLDYPPIESASHPSTASSRAEAASTLTLYPPWESNVEEDGAYNPGFDHSTAEFRELYGRSETFLE